MLQALDTDALKGRGLASIAASIAVMDWKRAMSYVDRISDENDRENARANVITYIGRVDRRHEQQLLGNYGCWIIRMLLAYVIDEPAREGTPRKIMC